MAISDIHDQMEQACQDQFGFGVRYVFLLESFAYSISQMIALGVHQNWPTTRKEIFLSFDVDPANVALAENVATSNFDVDAKYDVILHLPNVPTDVITQYTVQFSGGTATVGIDPTIDNKLSLNLADRGIYNWKAQSRPSDFLDKIKAAGFVDDDGNPDEQEFLRFEFALFTFQPDYFLSGLLDLIQFPVVREGLKTFRLGSPLNITFTPDYIAVHSENIEYEDRPCTFGISSASQISVLVSDEEIKKNTNTVFYSEEMENVAVTFDEKLDEMRTFINEVNVNIGPFGEYPIVYYYRKNILYDYTFGKVKPSVTYSDRNRFGPFRWYYAITAALSHLAIAFQQISPTTAKLTLDVPLEMFGQAGASIRLGCVTYNVLNVACEGSVNPLTVEAEGGVNMNTHEVFLSTKLANANPRLRWSTGFGFPFDQIATKLINWILRKEFRKFIGRPTDILRVPLADISDVAISSDLQFGALGSDAKTDSLLIGLHLDRG